MPGDLSVIAVLLLLAAFCAAASYVLIRLMLPLFRRYTMARPNARSSHRVPTPQGGGAAVLIATLIGLLLAAKALPNSGLQTGPRVALGLGAVLLAVIGAIDDLRPLPVAPRLMVQVLAAAMGVLPAWAHVVTPLLGLPAWMVLGPAMIGLIWFINLSNFMDGIDGITVAEFVPITLALCVLTEFGIATLPSGLIAAALGGALIGFVPFNRHIAKLFLGDVGSLAIGFVMGALLLELALLGHLVSALILPLYYLADATLTLLRRLINGERITEAHRSHFYQRATDLGWRVPEITNSILFVNIGLGFLAIAAARYSSLAIQVGTLAAAVALTAWLLRHLSRELSR